ncbi:MAG: HAD family hydrolase [Dehalococcoidia bacterium]
MTIRAVVFDLGHTIWDILPHDGAGLQRAYEDMRAALVERLGPDGVPPAGAIRQAVSLALHEASETYFMDAARLDQPPSQTWVDRGCRSLGLELDDNLLRQLTPPLFATEIDHLSVAEGTLEAVQALADAGYLLGCVTNTLADTTAIRAMLRRHAIEDLMRCVVVSADIGWRKPHPSLFQKALHAIDVAPHEAVFVGDSPAHDVAGAKAVGMWAVLTRQYVARPVGDLHPPADAVISHMRELGEVVRQLDASRV